MLRRFTLWILIAVAISGCSSSGSLGLVTKGSTDPASILRSPRPYKEIGRAEGEACRYLVLAIIPWGDSAFSTAVDDALKKSGGDALINVAVSSSLDGYIAIYNVVGYTCTAVKGTAIKFQ